MTTPTERAARVIYDVLSGQYGDFNMPDDAAQALADAGLLPNREEWGLRYQNLDDNDVYISTDGKESAVKAQSDGDVLVRRYVTDWEEVPDGE